MISVQNDKLVDFDHVHLVSFRNQLTHSTYFKPPPCLEEIYDF